MTWSFPHRKSALIAMALAVTAACTYNAATGRRQLSLIGEQQEIAMGLQYNKGVTAEFGLYQDEAWQTYIQEIGTKLAATSERPQLPWKFQVVDDDTVNAFAVPGGFIYITRGILAHFNSEAQLATVMGHEIGHVTARHSVEKISRAQLAQLGVGVAMVASEDFRQYSQLAQLGLGVLFLKFSRDDERQADGLGMRYLLRADYDPNEAPKVFEMLERHGQVQGQARLPEWQATHPSPERRIANLEEKIAGLTPEQQEGLVKRNEYLRRLEGMVFGKDPRQGFSAGSTFYHPDMAFRMDFPKGWKIVNQRQLVAGISPDEKAFVVLTLARETTPREAEQAFFSQEGIQRGPQWRQGFRHFEIAPQRDSAGHTSVPVRGTVGFRSHQGMVFRLICYTPADQWQNHDQAMHRSLGSFKRLTNRKYLDVHAKQLRIVRLPRDMSLETFNRKNPSTIKLENLAVLNGVDAHETLPKGTLVKRVVGDDPPSR
jgi:predicted Zn-dependent protease